MSKEKNQKETYVKIIGIYVTKFNNKNQKKENRITIKKKTKKKHPLNNTTS